MKTLRLVKFAALVAGLAMLAPHAASAGSSTGTLSVSASVVANCTVANQTLAFGSYDPVTNLSTAATASATISVTCTKGSSSVSLAANNGLNNANATTPSTRALSDGSGDYLSYDLYTDSGYTTIWNTTNTFAPTFATSTAATETVYGRIPAGQSPKVGSYTDTVTMTVNF